MSRVGSVEVMEIPSVVGIDEDGGDYKGTGDHDHGEDDEGGGHGRSVGG